MKIENTDYTGQQAAYSIVRPYYLLMEDVNLGFITLNKGCKFYDNYEKDELGEHIITSFRSEYYHRIGTEYTPMILSLKYKSVLSEKQYGSTVVEVEKGSNTVSVTHFIKNAKNK